MTRKAPLISRLLSDRSGNFALIFALMAAPMLMMAGAAVDFGMAYYIRNDLIQALDTATLAVASSSDTSTTALNERLKTIFAANYQRKSLAAATDPTMEIDGNIVSSKVSATYNTVLISALYPTLTIAAASEVSKQTTGIELVLALDTTGSMSDNNKMVELKKAAHSMISQIFGTNTELTSAFIGIVPFTDTVNIGSANTTYVTDPSAYDWGKDSHGNALGWGGCVMAPSGTNDRLDSYSSGGKWAPYYWPSDSSNYWKKIKNGKTTYAITSSVGPNVGCVSTPITPLTNHRAPLDTAIDALTPNGSTHINIGLAWAWYTISPEAPFTQGQPYDSPKYKKYVVLMTDGDNTFQTFGAYGYLSDKKLGTTNQTQAVHELNSRLLEVCNNMKAKGITIFTVALEVSSQTSRDMLANCATPPGRSFNAQSSDLTSVFGTIGGEISKVRIVK